MKVGLRPGLAKLSLLLSLLLASSFGLSVASGAAAALDQQLSSRGIRDARVLAAFAKVPRDVYVPVDAAERAFDEKSLPGAFAQTISQPYMLARMIEQLQLKPGARVLEVGTGTGYPAAVLSEIAAEVFSVGVIPEMAATARLRLAREGCQNVHVKLGDGALGWREYGPYDAIVVTSIGPRVPPALIDQLVEGGVLVMPVGPPRGRQVLLRGVKKGFKLHAKEAGELQPAQGERRSGGGERKPKDAAPPSRRSESDDRRSPRDLDDSRSDR